MKKHQQPNTKQRIQMDNSHTCTHGRDITIKAMIMNRTKFNPKLNTICDAANVCMGNAVSGE